MAKVELFDRNMQLLQKVLSLRQQNQQIISSNIANAETSGYRPARLEFTQELDRAMKTPELEQRPTRDKHIPINSANIEEVDGKVRVLRTPGLANGKSGVNVDQEMIGLSENQIVYEATVQMINKKLAILKYVSTDGN